MNGTKPWYLSKTVWGAIVALIASVLGFWGFDVTEGERRQIAEMIVQGLGAAGGLTALLGRFAARRVLR